MRLLSLIGCLLILSGSTCKNKKTIPGETCFRGRLEIKAGCMNYTIGVLSAHIAPSAVVPDWTDESTGKSYKNVFALASKCTFPSTIKEGDEFYFTIDSTAVQNCAVCMMYYPTPSKKLSIRVFESPCSP